MKNYGAPKHDLVNFYKSIIRPVLEYGDVLWTGGITVNHIYSGITYKLGESTETCNENYIPGIDLWASFRVVQRRNLHCINLVNELSHEDHKLNHLPPSRKMRITSRNTRSNKECFYNYPAKTNRFKSSPILYAVNIFNKSPK